jgi:hypothetical protein
MRGSNALAATRNIDPRRRRGARASWPYDVSDDRARHPETATGVEIVRAAQSKNWDIVTNNAELVNAVFDQAIWFNRSIVFLQLQGGDVEAGRCDRSALRAVQASHARTAVHRDGNACEDPATAIQKALSDSLRSKRKCPFS